MNNPINPTAVRSHWTILYSAIIGCLVVHGGATRLRAAEWFAQNPAQLSVALEKAGPGDRITMADGTWPDQEIEFNARGTTDQPITLCAQTPGQVVLTGKSILRMGGRFLVVAGLSFQGGDRKPANNAVVFRSKVGGEAENCRLTECVVVDYSPADRTIPTNYVTVNGRNNRIDHCYFSGKINRSAVLNVTFAPGSPPNHHRIDHNHFGYRAPFGENGAEAIQVGWSAAQQVDSRTVVEYNYFDTVSGEVEIITNKSCENIYRYNTFVRCEGALSLRVGDRCIVEGNFFFGHNAPHTSGVHVFGEDHRIVNNYFEGLSGTREKLGVQYGSGAAIVLMNGSSLVSTGEPRVLQFPTGGRLHPQVKRVVVAFNTFVDCTSMIDIGVAFPPFDTVSNLRPSDCVLTNNLVTGIPTDQIIRYSNTPEGLVCQGNLVGAPDGGPAAPVGFRAIDSQMLRDTHGIFRPSQNSAVIGAAVDGYPEVQLDIDAQPRPGKRQDVGCDQYSATAAPPGLMTPDQVGPRWLRFQK